MLSIEIITQFCEQLAKVVSKRVPENAPYASRFVQLLSKTLSAYSAKAVQPLDQSFRPLRRAILSQSLSAMFKAVESALEENSLGSSSAEKIDAAVKEEIEGVEWDAQLKVEMEGNITKVMQLVAQKIEQRLVLDPSILQMGERISSAQD
ncbi:unnamed protein product [Gongylonema pulchrum]|uniref:Uncharacterized protein n=1 Tax=Gongylonema pulchrum TaxID=637853 RepID=A0A3P6U6D0_9BILA|nr:unnamed protein product [Gongylonema pulchrum]